MSTQVVRSRSDRYRADPEHLRQPVDLDLKFTGFVSSDDGPIFVEYPPVDQLFYIDFDAVWTHDHILNGSWRCPASWPYPGFHRVLLTDFPNLEEGAFR